MNTAVGMNQALSLDAMGVKWPFAPQRRPASQHPSVRSPGVQSPVGGRAVVPVAPQVPKKEERHAGNIAPEASLSGVVSGLSGSSFAGWQATHSGVRVAGVPVTQVSRRQMISDVVLVAVWAAMIPGMLWFGHAAGF